MKQTIRSTFLMPLDQAGLKGQAALVTMDEDTAQFLGLDVRFADTGDEEAILLQWCAAFPRLRNRRDVERDLDL